MDVDEPEVEEDQLNADEYLLPPVQLPPIAALPRDSSPEPVAEDVEPVAAGPERDESMFPPRKRKRDTPPFLPEPPEDTSAPSKIPLRRSVRFASPVPSSSPLFTDPEAGATAREGAPAPMESDEEDMVLPRPRVRRGRASALQVLQGPATRADVRPQPKQPPEAKEAWWEAAIDAAQGIDVSMLRCCCVADAYFDVQARCTKCIRSNNALCEAHIPGGACRVCSDLKVSCSRADGKPGSRPRHLEKDSSCFAFAPLTSKAYTHLGDSSKATMKTTVRLNQTRVRVAAAYLKARDSGNDEHEG